jgi:hypothetical protein
MILRIIVVELLDGATEARLTMIGNSGTSSLNQNPEEIAPEILETLEIE